MTLNYRWLLQAAAFLGCIYSFLQIWERSKVMLVHPAIEDWFFMAFFGVLFLLCFFLMAVTSYLKQKANGTLKNSIPALERLIDKFRLMALTNKKE